MTSLSNGGSRWLARLGLAVEVAVAQARRYRLTFALAIVGVALAVLATTLLAGVGLGVVETGERQFDVADRDLWVTGGETRLTSAGGGGFENSIRDSREVAAGIERHDGVRVASPIAFQTVYAGPDAEGDLETFVGVGVAGGGPSIQVLEGEGLTGDPHYANGTYDGEMTGEVLLDAETAHALGVEVGDSLYVGGSLTAARNNEVTVVGISPTFDRMLGVATVTMPLSELHAATGSTRTEPATFIAITVTEDADVDAVQRDLEASHPELVVRSNREQLQAVLEEQALVLAAGASLVVLAVGAGIALTATLLALVVVQQRRAFAAITAQGVPSSTIVLVVLAQGVLIGVLGGLLGVGLTPLVVPLLDYLASSVVGYQGLVTTGATIWLAGFAIAVVVGTVAAGVAGVHVGRQEPLEHL